MLRRKSGSDNSLYTGARDSFKERALQMFTETCPRSGRTCTEKCWMRGGTVVQLEMENDND